MSESTRRAGKGPGTAYSAVAVLMFAVLSVLSLTPANPAPPAVAEFAPQSREQIKDAPKEQSSDFGSGEGGDLGTGTAASPSPKPGQSPGPQVTPPELPPTLPPGARVRRCVGSPPRQTEDPQSPPCVAFWKDKAKGNGGATSKGVTGDTITIAVPWIQAGPATGQEELTREVKALESFFNSRFEFYGRKLKLVKFPGKSEDVGSPDPPRQAADAVTVDQTVRAFASLPYSDNGGADFYYYDELARRKIVSVYAGLGTSASEAKLKSKHPYQWGIIPPADRIADNLGEWVCKNLKGRPTTWGGDDVNGKPRKYGILLSPSPDGTEPPIGPLRKRLAACGIAKPIEVEVPYSESQGSARTAALRLKNEGITTVLPWTHVSTLFLSVYPAADQAQYTPEWVVTSNLQLDEDTAGLLAPASQTSHSFGLRFQNKNRSVADLPANWAIKEADPGAEDISLANEKYIYQPLMVLASGIQAAGPNLTPETFGAALSKLQFPNPDHGAAPWYQAHVGFQGDHTWFDDATPVWWRPGETSRQVAQPTGAYCYVDGGRRYELGEWRVSRLFTTGSCY